jgi:hypothetical protein
MDEDMDEEEDEVEEVPETSGHESPPQTELVEFENRERVIPKQKYN